VPKRSKTKAASKKMSFASLSTDEISRLVPEKGESYSKTELDCFASLTNSAQN